eukprot:CAMPEP_0170640634 /NCGR_PEP_ID=MMETSP0224-20130122/40334_1 /TAXON_ID=285029 /ORGANISM="Togula jolla, Strain CCCM 725" /LENGTH=784 /DNA_ID=CAMNT_0010971163 /DNA_START=52 /DNA_END=2406 /DNA_ORIENTATION=+
MAAPRSQAQIDSMFDSLDQNHDGSLSREEFLKAVTMSGKQQQVYPGGQVPTTGPMQWAQRSTSGPQPPQTAEIIPIKGLDATGITFRHVTRNETVEKIVHVPTYDIRERIEEVPQVCIHERIVEVDEIVKEELLREVPGPYQMEEVTREVARPVYQGVEKIVEVPQVLTQEVVVEVPELQLMELIRQEPGESRTEIVQKQVDRPVITEIHEKVVEVPQVTVREQLVEVPVVEYVEVIKEVARMETQQVHKKVPKIETRIVDKVEEVHVKTYQDRMIEVPEIEYRDIIKQVPKIEVQVVERHVPVQKVEYIEKIVEVPQVFYEERVIEVPEVEIREVVKEVLKPMVEYIDKQVPRHIMQYYERVVDVPYQLNQETPEYVSKRQVVETLCQVPVSQMRPVTKEIPIYTGFEAREKVVEVPFDVVHEQPIQVPHVQYCETITQVPRPYTEIVEKEVPHFTETHPVLKVVQVPQMLRHERAVEVPMVKVVEAMRQEPEHTIQNRVREVPRATMEYIEKVVEVRPTLGLEDDGPQKPERGISMERMERVERMERMERPEQRSRRVVPTAGEAPPPTKGQTYNCSFGSTVSTAPSAGWVLGDTLFPDMQKEANEEAGAKNGQGYPTYEAAAPSEGIGGFFSSLFGYGYDDEPEVRQEDYYQAPPQRSPPSDRDLYNAYPAPTYSQSYDAPNFSLPATPAPGYSQRNYSTTNYSRPTAQWDDEYSGYNPMGNAGKYNYSSPEVHKDRVFTTVLDEDYRPPASSQREGMDHGRWLPSGGRPPMSNSGIIPLA